jgi:hypothetical protein
MVCPALAPPCLKGRERRKERMNEKNEKIKTRKRF